MMKCALLFNVFLWFSPGSLLAQGFEDLNNQAYQEMKDKNYNKAIELSTQSISKKTNARAYIIRGNCWYYLNDYETAIDDYTSGLIHYSEYYTSDKDKSTIYYFRGICRQNLGRYKESIDDFNSSLAYNYDNPGYVYWNRAYASYKLGKYQESDDDYAKAIDRVYDTKERSKLYKGRGDCHAKLGNYENGYTYYARAISYDADNYDAYWQRGYYEYITGKRDEALADYITAGNIIVALNSAALNSDLVALYRNQALIYTTLAKYDDALLTINKALQIDPNYSQAYHTRADIYDSLKKYEKAKSDYSNAISLQNDNKLKADLYLQRSKMEMKILEYKNALDDLNKATELNPADGENYWNRAIVYGYKKNYMAAISECNNAMNQYKNDSLSTASLIFLRASYKENTGNYQGAAQDYQEYLKYYPNSYGVYYNLGRLYKTKVKNNDLADANLSKAAKLAQKNYDTSEYCYIKVIMGDKEEAVQKMLECLVLNKDNHYRYQWNLHNMTCMYALSGNAIMAFEYLDKSLAAGFDDYSHLLTDRDLESIMSLPQWGKILAKYKVPPPKW
ncbi:MAG: hypothetical protein NVSMB7_11740 [Chitinophagaceae bacterium]